MFHNTCAIICYCDKWSSQQSEVLRLLRITKEYTLEENKTTKPVIPETKEMLTVSVLAIYNATE